LTATRDAHQATDEDCTVQLAPDKDAERQFLPATSTLKDRLLLADRGCPGVDYFEAIDEAGGAFIVRLTRSHDPWVRAAWIDGKRVSLPKPVCLSVFVAQHANRRMDLDVEYERDQGKRLVGFRVVVLPSKEKSMTRLGTDRPRTPFSLDLVARLYRFCWPACVPRCSSASWPRRPTRRRQAHLNTPRGDVRWPHHRETRRSAARVRQHRLGVSRRDGVPLGQRPPL
jgi:hypothetical protein